jgi:hypothetical protein
VVTLHTQSGERERKIHDTSMIMSTAPVTPIGIGILNSLFELLYDRDGSVGIESSGGLIKKQHLWLNDQFHSDTGPLPFSTRYSTKKLIPNLCTPIFE